MTRLTRALGLGSIVGTVALLGSAAPAAAADCGWIPTGCWDNPTGVGGDACGLTIGGCFTVYLPWHDHWCPDGLRLVYYLTWTECVRNNYSTQAGASVE